MGYDTRYVPCDCGHHLISISRWKDDDEYLDEIEISLWSFMDWGDSWRQRIRRAWGALRGRLHLDMVMLSLEEAEELAETIKGFLAEDPPTA